MKKIIATFLTFLGIITMTSCFNIINRRINIIVEGAFVGKDEYHENTLCYLTISKIDETEYNSANGINVIQDAINFNYFRIGFYTVDEFTNRTDYSFCNLKDAFNGATGTYISYKDDNNYWFTPFTTMNSSMRPIEECQYCVHITNEEHKKEVYSNLTYVDKTQI